MAGEAVEVLEGLLQRVLVHLRPALACQQQEGDALEAGRVHVAVTETDAAASVPAAVVHVELQVVGHLLNERQDRLVAGAQVILAEPDAAVAGAPGIGVNFFSILVLRHHFLDPAAGDLEVLLLAGREQVEQAQVNTRSGIVAGLRQPVRLVAHDLCRLRTVERPGLAVGAQHRNVYNNLIGCLGVRRLLDHELDDAVRGLGLRDDGAELDARINVLELLAVDRLDPLADLDLAGGLGGRSFVHPAHLHLEGRQDQVDTDADRSEMLNRRAYRGLARCGTEDLDILVELGRGHLGRGRRIGRAQQCGQQINRTCCLCMLHESNPPLGNN